MGTENSTLTRSWVHSHEEDNQYGPDALVFRPANFPFPRSRGRWRFDLGSDQSVAEVTPGPADRGVSRSGSWSINPHNQLVLTPGTPGSPSRVMDILEASPDRLVLSRPKPP